MSTPRPTTVHAVSTAVKVSAKATRTANAGYPCPYCPGTAAYRYDMGQDSRWFRCTGCGIEMPEAALTVHTPR